MSKLFEFDEHIGDWRVLIQSRDIQNGAIQSRHIASGAVIRDKIGDNAVQSRHISGSAVQSRHIDDNAVKSRHIGDGEVTGDRIEDDAVIPGKIADDAVATRNIKDYAVTPEKLDPDLLNQIQSAGKHGYALSGKFGDSTLIGIHQAALTGAFDAVWRKLEDITGEVLRGFSWEVTPTYFISETAETISVTAAPLVLGLKFEHIALYVDDVLLKEEEDVSTFSHTFEIADTSIVRCEAKILGVPYTRLQTVTHYNNFFLGAGSSYADIMDLAHVIPVKRGAYTIPVADGQRIIIVIGETLRDQFIRADINGMEIPFTETSVIVDGRAYRVFTSQNTFSEGEYNIDING